MSKSIISLREPIYTGTGTTQVIEVTSYMSDIVESHQVRFTLEDGREGLIPFKNISGIYPLKESSK